MGKPILCIDFDGVIHSYASGWKGVDVVSDPPVKGALRWLWKASRWWDVHIYSSRSKEPAGVEAMRSYIEVFAGHEWGDIDFVREKFMPALTFAHEKPSAFLTIDDRAVCFEGDWNELDPQALLGFKPWNKRPVGATGLHPQGVLNADDQGEIKIAIARDPLDGLVHINFGKPVAWTAMPPEQAIALAKLLMKHAGAKRIEVEL